MNILIEWPLYTRHNVRYCVCSKTDMVPSFLALILLAPGRDTRPGAWSADSLKGSESGFDHIWGVGVVMGRQRGRGQREGRRKRPWERRKRGLGLTHETTLIFWVWANREPEMKPNKVQDKSKENKANVALQNPIKEHGFKERVVRDSKCC